MEQISLVDLVTTRKLRQSIHHNRQVGGVSFSREKIGLNSNSWVKSATKLLAVGKLGARC